MKKHDKKELVLAVIFFIITCIIFCFTFLPFLQAHNKEKKVASCIDSGLIYDDYAKDCRELTVSEKFNIECNDSAYVINGKTFTCEKIKELGLEEAFLDKRLTTHGENLYELGTESEIAAGKQSGEYCLSAQESWDHIGEMRCVVFRPEYMACAEGYCFLDEKRDYTTGFVAFFGNRNMYSWDNFQKEYGQDVSEILVCGEIYLYRGYPQIRISNPGKQIVKNPIKRNGAYPYRCSPAN